MFTFHLNFAQKFNIKGFFMNLDSGIDLSPTFINFGFFSRPYGVIKSPMFINYWNFCQALQILILFFNSNSPKIKFLVVKALNLICFAKLFRPYDYFCLPNFLFEIENPTIVLILVGSQAQTGLAGR